ncbi:hypothetical protein THAR02_11350 [Trichoderma harzianum]|uniref:Uncharacterized protein n=1 Tax=Trichoderma harzianum TaxID=5544 RepID=A0A0F9X6W0_TRIHA|nr:hypothetical protein THAR02_11350 [Trichoderma harzianum]
MPEALSGSLQNLSYTLQKVGSCKIRPSNLEGSSYAFALLEQAAGLDNQSSGFSALERVNVSKPTDCSVAGDDGFKLHSNIYANPVAPSHYSCFIQDDLGGRHARLTSNDISTGLGYIVYGNMYKGPLKSPYSLPEMMELGVHEPGASWILDLICTWCIRRVIWPDRRCRSIESLIFSPAMIRCRPITRARSDVTSSTRNMPDWVDM